MEKGPVSATLCLVFCYNITAKGNIQQLKPINYSTTIIRNLQRCYLPSRTRLKQYEAQTK